jgi:hypothetical protein
MVLSIALVASTALLIGIQARALLLFGLMVGDSALIRVALVLLLAIGLGAPCIGAVIRSLAVRLAARSAWSSTRTLGWLIVATAVATAGAPIFILGLYHLEDVAAVPHDPMFLLMIGLASFSYAGAALMLSPYSVRAAARRYSQRSVA